MHWPFSFTIDADRALLYASFESPGPDDYYGGDSPGDNLFGNSIVALDARTGKRRGTSRPCITIIWDYDCQRRPGCSTSRSTADDSGASAGRQDGYLYMLNRVTGKPVFGIEERPVPHRDVPGEKTSPTQPIPLKPPPLARVATRQRTS